MTPQDAKDEIGPMFLMGRFESTGRSSWCGGDAAMDRGRSSCSLR